MNGVIATSIALIAGATLSVAAVAQGRHDDKPHGYDKQKAAAAAAKPQPADGPTVGGRHDEKPHGTQKSKPAPKSGGPAAPQPPAAAPAATTPAVPK